jgi:hypothetical protein
MPARLHIGLLLGAVTLLSVACGSQGVGQTGAGAGSGASSSPASAARITLALSGAATHGYRACGSDKPFLTASGGRPLTATGLLSPVPAGGSRIKIKVKQCVAGTWQTVAETHVSFTRTGAYHAFVPMPGPGAYTVRAYYYAGSQPVKSAKSYMRISG